MEIKLKNIFVHNLYKRLQSAFLLEWYEITNLYPFDFDLVTMLPFSFSKKSMLLLLFKKPKSNTYLCSIFALTLFELVVFFFSNHILANLCRQGLWNARLTAGPVHDGSLGCVAFLSMY